MNSMAPNGAVAAGGLAASTVVIIVWIVKVTFHLDIPDYVQDALTVLAGSAGVWIHPSGRVPKV
jgi:hypothetical protein